jgi:formylglycine-generating enzyme required for sulfatase activity
MKPKNYKEYRFLRNLCVLLLIAAVLFFKGCRAEPVIKEEQEKPAPPVSKTPHHQESEEVQNVRIDQIKDRIVVQYDLLSREPLEVRVKFLEGETPVLYSAKSLSGDIGEGVGPGIGKRIFWDVFRDYPEGLALDALVAEVTTRKRSGGIWQEPTTGMEFVWVPGGCYQMGCGSWTSSCAGDENPVHEVCVDGFWMGKYEVTQGQWKRVMVDNPSSFKEGDNYPVEGISWNNAREFANKLVDINQGRYKFRLPTEAEWEYACRSGGKLEGHAGGGDVERIAWYWDNSDRKTHPVGAKDPNGLGLYDMSGNVWEWCEDLYNKEAYTAHDHNNPVHTMDGHLRVIRGGGWFNMPWGVRCALRGYLSPGVRYFSLGFRVVSTD